MAGLDQELQTKIHEMGAKSMDEALKVASRCERARAALQLSSTSPPPPKTTDKVAMIRSQSTEDRLLKAVDQLTLTVNSLKSDVQQLQEKNTYLTQRLGSWYGRSSVHDGPQRRTRSPSPHFHHAQRHSPHQSSPDRYTRGAYPYATQRSVSPEAVGARGEYYARARHVSPDRLSHLSFRNSPRSDTDRWRRSPSPSSRQARDTSPISVS